jgi:hypothetical protein
MPLMVGSFRYTHVHIIFAHDKTIYYNVHAIV